MAKLSTAPDAPFTLAPAMIARLRELRGRSRLAFVSVYDTTSQTAVHAAIRQEDILSVAISCPTPQAQARREHVALADHMPDGAATAFEILEHPLA